MKKFFFYLADCFTTIKLRLRRMSTLVVGIPIFIVGTLLLSVIPFSKSGRPVSSVHSMSPRQFKKFALLCDLVPLWFKNATLIFTLLSIFQLGYSQKNQRYKIGLIDLMLLKRQKLGAIPLTKQIGADGIEVDMGGLGNRRTFDNQLLVDSVRKQFLDKAKELNIEIFSLAMTGYYAQSFCNREEYKRSIEDCITTMKLMNVKTAFLPLGVQCDLKKNPSVRDSVVARLKVAGKIAEQAAVIIGIETALSAKEEVELLKEINSPAIKIYFNFSNPLKERRDLITELKTLGRDRICMIHATNKDSVWLENDPQIDMYKVKKTLDEMGWSGWLVIERSRDAKKPSDVKENYGANTAYLKKVFQ